MIFGTSKGLFSLNKTSSHYDKIPLLNYKDLKVESIFFSGEFYLIGTTDEGLFRVSEDFTRTEKVYSLPYSSQSVPLSAITNDRSGNFYISTKGDGLIVLDENLNLISQHRLENGDNSSLADSHIKGLYADDFNTLWIYTDFGQLHSLNIRQKYFEFLRNDPQKYSSLADNVTSAIEKDSNGNIWFGTREGLSIWNIKNNTWQHLKNLSFTQAHNEPDVIKDLHANDIHMWVATYNDGLYKVNINTFLRAHYSTDAKTKTSLQKVSAVIVDSNQNVWAGGEEGGIIRISPSNDIVTYPVENIEALHQLSSGSIIAAGKNGVYSLTPGGNEFVPISKLQPGWDDLPYFTINSISETPSGEILLATEGAGIVIYDLEKDSFKKINRKNGLPSNRIRGLIMNGRDEVWAGTSRGLIFLEMKEDSAVRVFDKDA
ncbi:hypothetical protein LZ575_20475 [Antarcticibacterium sp. 1MA-6-2]|uniref:ligand-binding sensor domain-containing protein n=1 Tax=Antarcticibacterium sp. 1MA-6-2 TaxID=2908210 RepID=UPI001F253B5F|nr:two-component regulator propeller domain-containing protein [Antarcticibacterium sp. 1MA-6-2]UJH91018.1 hypothetical protein LZ575_20475 [Antarcticibacterium sp. 1MA-6-2]